MRLTDDVLLVGGGALTGFGLSSDFDAHVYLLDGGDDLALVDCGMGTEQGMELVLGNVRADGLDPERLSRLYLTHYHTDHAGGAARYKERLGLSVAIAEEAREALETADHGATGFEAARAAGVFPEDYVYGTCAVDDGLADGETRAVGRLELRFLSTPGHCRGHGSYIVTGAERTYLLAGDALFAGGKLLLQAIPDCDLHASLESVRRLGGLEFDALLPGHGAISLREGRSHVELALRAIGRLAVPPSIV